MNFTEAVSEVVSILKRPDKIATVRKEVNAAISFYTLDNECPRDFSEQAIVLDAQSYTQSFALSEMTRFRKFKYIKRGGTTEFLAIVGNAELEKGCVLNDRYYIAGSNVNIAMKKLAATLDVGFYAYAPILNDSDGSHWLLDHSPYMIMDRACAKLFRDIGDERSMSAHAQSAAEAYIAFRRDLATNQ